MDPNSPDVPLAEPVPEPRVGDRVGPYPLLGELGRGGMAVVYRSEDPVLSREVALKIMLPKVYTIDPQAKDRFIREARAQAKVENGHVCVIYQAGELNGVPFIAMPRLKGRTLAAKLKELRDGKQRLPVTEALRIAREIATGLEAAHAVGLVHRDIKPGNVWLEDPKGWVKLLDFGLAREEAATPRAGGAVGRRRAIVGTPAYMSPEQTAGGFVDARTDLWSLGVILYQMLSGEKPFVGATRDELFHAVANDEPLPLDVPGLPSAVSELLRDLLAKRAADRPESAADVIAALAAVEKLLDAPRVVQLPATAVVAAPELWGALDDTDKDDEPKQERPKREAPKYRSKPSERPAKGPPWALIGGGAALGLLLLGVLVWLAVKPSKVPPAKDETASAKVTPKDEPKRVERKNEKKSEPEKAPEPEKKVEPEKKEPEKKVEPAPPAVPAAPDDRKAATVFHQHATLQLLVDGQMRALILPNQPLPMGRLDLMEINFGNTPLQPNYLTETLLPNVKNLKSLEAVHARQLVFGAEHLQMMSGMPFSDRLVMLHTAADLTPDVTAALAKFPALAALGCRVTKPTDALFAKLSELKVKALILENCDPRKAVTADGWASLAKLPLKTLCLINCHLDKTSLGGMAKGKQSILYLLFSQLDTDGLLELSSRPTQIKDLTLWEVTGLTNNDLRRLAKAESLSRVVVSGGAVTADGVKGLQKERPTLLVENPPKGTPLNIQLEYQPAESGPK